MSQIITGLKTSSALALLPITLTSRLTRTITGLALALLPACACTQPPSTSPSPNGRTTMSDQIREKNRHTVETLFESFSSGGDLSHLDDLIAPDYVGPQGDKGPDGFR